MLVVAWDIETCPIPVEKMSRVQHNRYVKELEREKKRSPVDDRPEVSRRVRSLHPHLSWICTISAASGTIDTGPNFPKSWTAPAPSRERTMLEQFWCDVSAFPASTVWATFNGKRFDVPFLTTRTAAHGLRPSRYDLLDTYPYRHRPHADLARFTVMRYSLEDLCDLLNVASPKQAITAHSVADYVTAGDIDAVARYCERDVIATFECLRTLAWLL